MHIYITLTPAFSALTLLVGWREEHPACKKTEWWGAGVVIGLERGADLHMARLMPLPLTVSCFSKIQIGFTFLAPAQLGKKGKVFPYSLPSVGPGADPGVQAVTWVVPEKGPLNGCVCVCHSRHTDSQTHALLTVSSRSMKKSRSSLLWFRPNAILMRPRDRF